VISYIESDLAQYKKILVERVAQVQALKDRLMGYVNTEEKVAREALNTKFNYELKTGDSTADKSYYDTPSASMDVSISS
jgi:hypothetical protein